MVQTAGTACDSSEERTADCGRKHKESLDLNMKTKCSLYPQSGTYAHLYDHAAAPVVQHLRTLQFQFAHTNTRPLLHVAARPDSDPCTAVLARTHTRPRRQLGLLRIVGAVIDVYRLWTTGRSFSLLKPQASLKGYTDPTKVMIQMIYLIYLVNLQMICPTCVTFAIGLDLDILRLQWLGCWLGLNAERSGTGYAWSTSSHRNFNEYNRGALIFFNCTRYAVHTSDMAFPDRQNYGLLYSCKVNLNPIIPWYLVHDFERPLLLAYCTDVAG